MKRRYLFLIAFAALSAFFAAMVPWTIATDPVARHVGSHLRALTGLELFVDGRATLAILPLPRIKLEEVTLTSAEGEPLVRAGQLRGELRLLPLLVGRMELSDAMLLKPTITVTTDAVGRSPWEATVQRLAEQVDPARLAEHRVHIGRLIIMGGTLIRDDQRVGSTETIRDINLVVSWPRPASAIDVVGTLAWRDEPVDVKLIGLNPAKLSTGETSDVYLRVELPNASFALSGEVTGGGDAQFSGRVSLTTASLRDTERWLRTGFPVAAVVDDFTLEGPLTANRRSLSLPSVIVRLGPDTLEGALIGRITDGRLSVSGTLAAGTLDFSRFVSSITPDRDDSGGWNREPIRAAALANADLDVRLSANTAKIGRMSASAVAAGVILKNGRLEVALGRASAYKGAAKGRFSLTPTQNGVEAKLQGSFEHLDFAAALTEASNSRRLSGTGQAQVVLEAEGASVADLARSLTGRASISIKQGEITGFDLAEAVRRSERRPLAAAFDWNAGRTSFDHLGGTLLISKGIADISNGTLSAPSLRTTLGGRILLADRAFAMHGQLNGTVGGTPAKGLPFEILGGWDEPLLSLDVQALIQRSGAAAPLLGTRQAAPLNALTGTP